MSEVPTSERQYEGITGWLIFPAFGTIIAPLVLAYLVFSAVNEVVAGLPSRLLPLAIFDIVALNILLAGWVAAVLMLVQKKRQYPLLYVALMLAGIARSAIAVAWVESMGLYTQPFITDLARTVAASAIWVPYMLISKRVRATFVN